MDRLDQRMGATPPGSSEVTAFSSQPPRLGATISSAGRLDSCHTGDAGYLDDRGYSVQVPACAVFGVRIRSVENRSFTDTRSGADASGVSSVASGQSPQRR